MITEILVDLFGPNSLLFLLRTLQNQKRLPPQPFPEWRVIIQLQRVFILDYKNSKCGVLNVTYVKDFGQ
jgi:hypothetical protein